MVSTSSLRILLPLACLFASNFGAQAKPPSTPSTVVDLGYARYQGKVDATTRNTHFYGIRYAAPPVGELRFSAPQNPARVAGVQNATEYAPHCPQAGPGGAESRRDLSPTINEDCLFLNVFVPGTINPSAPKKKVIVWIHGGGYVFGGSLGDFFTSLEMYNGDDLIRESQDDTIVVVMQYRLGLFGFLPGEQVKRHGALNAGMLDQEFALQWVQQHISKFGGDPNQVTAWGQSAGGASVVLHLLSRDARPKPLFKKAILSSLFLPPLYQYNERIAEGIFSDVLRLAGCEQRNAIRCLREKDVETLMTANAATTAEGFFGTTTFGPVIEGPGGFLTQRPSEALRDGKIKKTDGVLATTNSLEGHAFINPQTINNYPTSRYIQILFPKVTPSQARLGELFYSKLGSNFDRAVAIMTEAIFICPTYNFLSYYDGPAWKAEFAVPQPMHSQDLFYYYKSMNDNSIPPYNNTDFVDTFTETYFSFMKSNDPNTKMSQRSQLPRWNHWNGGSEMLFNHTDAGMPDIRSKRSSRELLQRCDFWDDIRRSVAQ